MFILNMGGLHSFFSILGSMRLFDFSAGISGTSTAITCKKNICVAMPNSQTFLVEVQTDQCGSNRQQCRAVMDQCITAHIQTHRGQFQSLRDYKQI